jgi:hypothetical protein
VGIIRLCSKRVAIGRRSGGRTILIYGAAALLCLIWLAGCGSSSSNSDYNAGGSDNNAGNVNAPPSSGCFLTGLVRPGHKSRSAKQLVLASALVPMPIVPVEHPIDDFSRPTETDLGQQHDWANEGVQNANSDRIELPQGSLDATQANLQSESNAVAYKEELTLLTDDADSQDPSYGAEICDAIERVQSAISNLNDLNQVINYLQQLASNNNTQAPNDLANVIQDGTQQFEQAFGQCINDLSVPQWVLEQIQTLFCE